MADSERVLNSDVTTTLRVVQRDEAGDEAVVDADATPTAEIRVHSVLEHTITADDVTRVSTGVYTFEWVPTTVGVHTITWSFEVGEEEYEVEETVDVLADVEGTSDSSSDDEDAEDVPAIGASRVCRVTGSFYDASGAAMPGVLVRFTPTRTTTSFVPAGIVASEVTAESDADGVLDFNLVRGLTGTLAITGLGIVREITVPDQGAVTVQGLAELGDDPLEVQTTRFKQLPRRS